MEKKNSSDLLIEKSYFNSEAKNTKVTISVISKKWEAGKWEELSRNQKHQRSSSKKRKKRDKNEGEKNNIKSKDPVKTKPISKKKGKAEA